MEPLTQSNLVALYDLVRAIPEGRCASYGRLGQALPKPVSGLFVGRWMHLCPPDIPWWRVVGTHGDLLIAKKDPHAAREQRQRLMDEGVPFYGDNVALALCSWDPDAS